jgi:simple sugar transport system permease protein
MGGLEALMLCFLISFPIALLFGYLTGKLYNKVRGQEMVASLIVGFFAQGIYNFILLFAVGIIIPVKPGNPLMLFNNIGVRMTIDLGLHAQGGMKYALDYIIRVPFMYLVLTVSLGILAFLIIKFARNKKKPQHEQNQGSKWRFIINCSICAVLVIFSLYNIITDSDLMMLKKAPLVTVLVITALCLFITFLNKTKLGQDFRSVGHNQHIAEVSGINVDRTRIIATIMSTVIAAWGMIIFLQDMGHVSTYTVYRNVGFFSVAAILVGGATAAKASVKNAMVGLVLFHAMFIVSPAVGLFIFNDGNAGEYMRTFMVYGVIGVSLGLYVWKANKAARDKEQLDIPAS